MRTYLAFKRALDLSVSGAALLLFSPALAVTGALIKADDGGPVFFSQIRVGKDGKPFRIHKLRTMRVDHQTQGQVNSSSPGVTRLGRFLRRTKIDELPQLVNVLRGDMSLVGPRPCLPETLTGMPAWARARFDVRPGLTGLAQVKGNAAIPWEARWRYDVRYVKGIGLRMDLYILSETLGALASGEEKRARLAR